MGPFKEELCQSTTLELLSHAARCAHASEIFQSLPLVRNKDASQTVATNVRPSKCPRARPLSGTSGTQMV
eukprot:6517223-Lingulodinium_polyedra.AAC.1